MGDDLWQWLLRSALETYGLNSSEGLCGGSCKLRRLWDGQRGDL